LKPGDHPEFFRFPAPAGRSRESSIVLDGRGRFWHAAELVENPAMQRAFFSWIRRHPDDGRYILSNGYDWTYLRVEDAPLFVLGVNPREGDGAMLLRLSDGSAEVLGETAWIGADDALYTKVRRGELDAKFTPSAQAALGGFLSADDDGRLVLLSAGNVVRVRSVPSEGDED
jgi:uncharacterized protein